jgi:hypothetical protein
MQCTVHCKCTVYCTLHYKCTMQRIVHCKCTMQCTVHCNCTMQCTVHSKCTMQCTVHCKCTMYCTVHFIITLFNIGNVLLYQSQWPCALRHRPTAARLLRLWVRIPRGAWTFVCCVWCQVEVSATGWLLVQRSPTDCDTSLCVTMKPRERGSHSPCWAAEPEKIIIMAYCTYFIN